MSNSSRLSTSSTTTRAPCWPAWPSPSPPQPRWCGSSSKQQRSMAFRPRCSQTMARSIRACTGQPHRHGDRAGHPRDHLQTRQALPPPQTQGKVERYHLTLKKWLAKKPPVATLAELQAQIDRFVHIYNEERPHTARGCPPMQAWRALDKATVELDGQPLLAHTKVRRDRSTRPAASPVLPLQAPPRRRRTRTQRQASADPDGRPRRPGHRRGRRHDPTPRARPLGQLPGEVNCYLLKVHVSQKIPRHHRVEVKGLEPSASTLRMCGSQPSDQALSEEVPGSGVSIPSGSLTIPPTSRTVKTRKDTPGQPMVGSLDGSVLRSDRQGLTRAEHSDGPSRTARSLRHPLPPPPSGDRGAEWSHGSAHVTR